MKTTITITGQISGNHLLKNKIQTFESETRNGMFNSFIIEFPTKKAAEKALWEAYKSLRGDHETKSSTRYCKKYSLSYDASCATIND